MNEYEQDYSKINSENFTQKDLMQYLLHSTQHVATREELQITKMELKTEIQEVRTKIQDVKTELKTDMLEIKTELKAEIKDTKIMIDKLDIKIDRMQWFMIAGMLSILGVLLKDYII
jgi:hypothetical protein